MARTHNLDLVGLTDIAEMAGVRRQRALYLVTRSDFPIPAARTRTGRHWYRREVEAFFKTWDRKPGRPKKAEG